MLKQKQVKLEVDTGDTLKDASLIMLSDYCHRTSIYNDKLSQKYTMFKEQWDFQNKKQEINKEKVLERSDNLTDDDWVAYDRRVSLEF